jgi:hypothetical protein
LTLKYEKSFEHLSSDTTQLIMKVVMHELDYDMDDNDLQFLEEINQYMTTKRMIFFFLSLFY